MFGYALKHSKKSVLTLIGAAALTLTLAGPAMADQSGDETDITVSSGSLVLDSVPEASTFSSIQLDGTNKTANSTLSNFDVIDATGTGNGWQLQIRATQFREWDGTDYVTDGATLPAGSLQMEQVTVAAGAGSSSANDLAVGSGPYTLDTASPVTLVTAGATEGMGTFTVSAADNTTTLTLSVPANTYATTYRSVVFVDVASTP